MEEPALCEKGGFEETNVGKMREENQVKRKLTSQSVSTNDASTRGTKENSSGIC